MFKSTRANIVSGLKTIPPGVYSVKDISGALKGGDWITWGSNWLTVKYVLESLPEWSWNKKRGPFLSRWIKAEPAAIVIPKKSPAPDPDPDEPQKSPVSTALFRMESMLEELCNSLGIASRPVPTDITCELKCRAVLETILKEIENNINSKDYYVKRRQLVGWRCLIKLALSGV
jgi:hypothetical protein